jgi:hypothetical protein
MIDDSDLDDDRRHRNGETKYVIESRVVWPEDKDGNIVYKAVMMGV